MSLCERLGRDFVAASCIDLGLRNKFFATTLPDSKATRENFLISCGIPFPQPGVPYELTVKEIQVIAMPPPGSVSLPQLFRSILARYQNDINTIVDWLLRASRYVPDGAQLDDHETLRNKFSCRELVRMAEMISYSPTASVPCWIFQLLQSIIQARKRCAEWFRA